MTAPTPDKRPAFESPARLLGRTGFDPAMPRPAAIVTGVVLVLLGVVAEAVVLAAVVFEWDALVDAADVRLDGATPATVSQFALWAVVGVGAAVLLLETVLAVLIYRGVNWARVVIMLFAVFSISASFSAWWVDGQEIRISGTFVAVALDVLLLLALSSRPAAAYARRNERG